MDKQKKLKKIQDIELLVKLMDSQFSFMGFSFGFDGLIGLIPGFGDAAGGIISVLIILRIRHIGVSDEVFNKMMRNILIDVFVGSVPVIGDMFDFGFKVNERNMELAKEYLQSLPAEQTMPL